MICPYYQNDLVQRMYAGVVCVQTSQIFIHTLFDFIDLEMLRNNAIVTIVVLSVFLIWGVSNYQVSLIEKSFFLNVEDIKSKQQLFLLINSYYNALRSLDQDNNLSELCLVVSSIRRNHQNTCKNL